MNSETALQGVKTEKEFIWAALRLGLVITLAVTVVSVAVAWLVVRNHPPQIQFEALTTATILPLVIAPVGFFFNNRQSLRNHRLMLEINRLAHTDEMTGLANRRSFISEASAQLAEADFAATGLCLFLIDLDHFKAVNDQYGHAAGDETLVHVSAQMRASIPAGALIARLGGEEFAVMLPFESFADIHAHAEALREAVANHPCLVDQDVIHVTISVGIGIASTKDTVSSLLSRADCALYAAKDEGRNRFSIAA